jgi:hypothetical protein
MEDRRQVARAKFSAIGRLRSKMALSVFLTKNEAHNVMMTNKMTIDKIILDLRTFFDRDLDISD